MSPAAEAAAIWPASGVALGVLLLLGSRMITAVAASALAGNLVTSLFFREPDTGRAAGALVAIAIATGATLAPWMAAKWILSRINARNALRQGRAFFIFVGAVLVSQLVGAMVATAARLAVGQIPTGEFFEVAVTGWSSAVIGVLVVTPLILLLARGDFSCFFNRRARWEALALLALIFVTGQALAGFGSLAPMKGFSNTFLIVPLLLWIGFRFRGFGVAIALLVLSAIAVAGALHGHATFPGFTDRASLLYAQGFIGILALVGFGFVAVLDERDDHLADVELLNAALESKVAARTRQLERINQELTDTISVIAHDVRGPVAGIRTLAHHMRWSSLDLSTAEGNEMLGEIESTSGAAAAMMARLLDLQRANDHPGRPVPTDLGALVESVCRAHDVVAREKRIEMRFVPSRSAVRRMVDVEGVKFIATNLISNALKFLPEGGTVEVRVDASNFNCRLAVIDNGPGLSPAECAGIFRRFVKAVNRPTGGESSTGLGLFIVRKLVMAMNGTLYVESSPGEGAIFVAEWPAEGETAAVG